MLTSGDTIMKFAMILATIGLLFSFQCQASVSIKDMSIEEKVGQLLMVYFRGNEANEEAKRLIQDLYVGGIIYYSWANELSSPGQVKMISKGLKEFALETRLSLPLFIAADQEGGLVVRVKGLTEFPGNKALGMTGDPQLAKLSARIIGKELRAIGINMNLAPVVDINNNPQNPVIGIRSFGDTANIVLAFAEKAMEGYKEAGILCVLKHFPGHGDVATDSHEQLPVINKSLQELENNELIPFSHLQAKADAMMTGHLLVPALDPQYPTTLSRKTLDFLRNEIGFQGIIMSDSLVMEGILNQCDSLEEASIRAFNAGCDILLLGGRLLTGKYSRELKFSDIQSIHQSVVQAVKSGRIEEDRLNQSVERILELKARIPSPLEDSIAINDSQSQEIAQKIAELSIRVTKNDLQLDISKQKILLVAPQVVQENLSKTSLPQLGKSTLFFFFKGLNPTEEETQLINTLGKKADMILFCSYNAWKNDKQAALIHSLSQQPLVLIAVRDPLDAALFPNARLILTTFSPSIPSLQAAYEKISR
jgi:beta-N-acetylhexosaminidase